MTALTRWAWVFALVGGVLLVGAATAYALSRELDGYPTYFTIGAAVSFLAWVGFDQKRLAELVASRNFIYGSGAWLMVAMAGGVAVGGYALSRQHDHTWDWSKQQSFSISDHTKTVLKGLDEDVRVIAFFRNGSPGEHDLANLMRLFGEQTPRLKVEYVDPLKSPRLAEKYDIVSDTGTIVLERGEKTKRLTEVKETALIDALVLLMSDEEHRVCWSLGHGEPEPDDEFEKSGLGGFVVMLEGANYQVTKTRIAQEGIDRKCEVLVLARPTIDPFPYEREAIAAYLAEGGRVLLALEPFTVPELSAELARYGVQVGADLVVDVDPKNSFMGVEDPSVVVLSDDNITDHEITKNLSAALVFPSARSVGLAEPMPEGLTGEVLLRSSPQSWAETRPDQIDAQPDDGEKVGEVPLMVAVSIGDPAILQVAKPSGSPAAPPPAPPAATVDPAAAPVDPAAPAAPAAPPAPKPELDLGGDVGRAVPADFSPKPGGRLVVVGDTEFFSNSALGLGNNKDLGLNTLAWMVDEADQIGERPQDGDKLTITAAGEAMTCLVSIGFVPGAAIGLAILTLVRRRYL